MRWKERPDAGHRQYVDSVKRDYDYVLLDCCLSLGMLAINALPASDYVLIPVQAD